MIEFPFHGMIRGVPQRKRVEGKIEISTEG